ncbi:hypothetical protein D9M68_521240 [compost metagenome]
MPAERLDLEGNDPAIGFEDLLAFQVDVQGISRRRFDRGEQSIDDGFVEDDRQQAILEAIVMEDFRETRSDQRPDAPFVQGPGRVFAARSAAEVCSRKENSGTFIARLIERKFKVQRAL